MARTASKGEAYMAAGKPPISLHPAFPAIVALWFAALLGLGSMVLPLPMLERILAATGLPALVPATAAPLGATARALIALSATIAGALVGFVIARRVARSHNDAPSGVAARFGRRSKSEPRKPFDASEVLNTAVLTKTDGSARRRNLAIAEDERASDFLAVAPLPGEDYQPGEVKVTGPAAPEAAPNGANEDDALELTAEVPEQAEAPSDTALEDLAGATQPSHSQEPPSLPQIDIPEDRPFDLPAAEAAAAEEPLVFSAPSLARRHEPAKEDPAAAGEFVPLSAVEQSLSDPRFQGDWVDAPLAQLGLVQLVQRLGHSIDKRRELIAQARASTAAIAGDPRIAARHHADLPGDLEVAPAEEAAQAMAAYFGAERRMTPRDASVKEEPKADASEGEERAGEDACKTADMVARLGGFGGAMADDGDNGDDDDEDYAQSLVLPMRRESFANAEFAPGQAPEFADSEEPEEVDDSAEIDGFGSLVNLRNPFREPANNFVRVEEPEEHEEGNFRPSVVFPNQERQNPQGGQLPSPADSGARPFDPPAAAKQPAANSARAAPVETDEALREALAKLQRMSGTA